MWTVLRGTENTSVCWSVTWLRVDGSNNFTHLAFDPDLKVLGSRGERSTGPLSDLRYMFRQTKEWRQAAEPAYGGYSCSWVLLALLHRHASQHVRHARVDVRAGLGVVSLTFRELSKIFSRNLCIAEIVLLMRISSRNFVRVPKAMLWAHIQSFSLKFS